MTTPQAAPGTRRGGPPAWFAIIAVGSLVLAVLLLVLQVAGIGVGVRLGGPTMAPAGQASEVTRARVIRALEAASFQVQEPVAGYRPAESPSLVNVPRRLVQAVVPASPEAGYVVIYELPGPNDADRAGRELLAYVGGGTGAIQYPRDTRFVLQRVGPTLVFFAWSAEATPDAPVAEIAAALQAIGTPVRP